MSVTAMSADAAFATASPLVSLRGLRLARGRLELADRISFDVSAGGFVELHGANGAGKSTLLRVLAGVQPVEQGALQVDGSLAFFAAPFGLRRELTVVQQLCSAVSLYGRRLTLPECKVLLGSVGLAHKALELTSRLSQGQRSRLGLCILKASGARIWLMDEPVNALDAEGVALLGRFLQEHFQAGGCAVIATHQPLPPLVPALAGHLQGVLEISGGTARFSAAEVRKPAAVSTVQASGNLGGQTRWTQGPIGGLSSLAWVLGREWRLFQAAPKAAVWPAVFHAMVLCLFPIGLGADVNLLMRVAAGLFWVSCLLACVLSAAPAFESDYNEGVLAQMRAAGLPLAAVASGKILVAWLTQGGALALISGVLALQYRLPGVEIGFLMLSLALGAGVLVHLAAFFGAMTLMARQSSMLVYLLALPLFVPVLVFGTSVLISVQGGQDPVWPLTVLAGLSLLSSLAIPWLAAQLLAWAME